MHRFVDCVGVWLLSGCVILLLGGCPMGQIVGSVQANHSERAYVKKWVRLETGLILPKSTADLPIARLLPVGVSQSSSKDFLHGLKIVPAGAFIWVDGVVRASNGWKAYRFSRVEIGEQRDGPYLRIAMEVFMSPTYLHVLEDGKDTGHGGAGHPNGAT